MGGNSPVDFPADWAGAKVLFLDCDSTLSSIEGIDELALRGDADVAQLTARAMAGELPLDAVYKERLRMIQPTASDFEWLSKRYWETRLSGALETIAALQGIGVRVCVVSGGLLPAVQPFAERLGVAPSDIFAVPYPLDSSDPMTEACAHPLAKNGGKPSIVESACHGTCSKEARMLVGDGVSDLEASSALGLFVGFGAVESREQVRAQAPVFLDGPGLWSVALYAAGPSHLKALRKTAPKVYEYAVSEAPNPR
ncbi:MAG: HAD-IB family phosphatase [Planctomycetota bacterium]|jgi:phosphoserine phosphatase|nr:HAD-IB family phosphatase [Planctomycetota bacterium]